MQLKYYPDIEDTVEEREEGQVLPKVHHTQDVAELRAFHSQTSAHADFEKSPPEIKG